MQSASQVQRKLEKELEDVLENLEKTEEIIQNSNIKHTDSFLALRNFLFSSYNFNLLQYLQKRLEGQDLKDDNIIKRLLHLRTCTEKTRPLHKKLDYRYKKQLQTASLGQIQEENNPLAFRPNLDDFDLDDDEDIDADGSDGDETGGKPEDNIYRPPKINPVHYDEENGDGLSRKEERRKAYEQKQILSSEFIKVQRRKMNKDVPEELENQGTKAHEMTFREQYEEDNFIRLQVSKEDKAKENKRNQYSHAKLMDFTKERALESMMSFGEIDAEGLEGVGKKRKRGKKGGKKGKGSKKKKKFRR